MQSLVATYRVLVMIGLIFVGCGKDNDKDSDSGSQNPLQLSTAEQLMSDWNGVYNTLSDGEPSGDPMAAIATFKADYQFEIMLEQDANAKVTGTWSEFQGKTIILKILGSTMSSIGAAGKIVEADFDLIGNSLRVQNKSFILRLSKKASTTPTTPGSGDGQIFSGSWSCDDGVGRTSKITFDDQSNYKLITIRSGERALLATGSVANTADGEVGLKITSSSDPMESGSSFILRKIATGAQLFLSSGSGPMIDLGKCRR